MTERMYDAEEVSIRECISGAYCWLDALTTDLHRFLETINMLMHCDGEGKLKEQVGTAWAASTKVHEQCKVLLNAVSSMSRSLREDEDGISQEDHRSGEMHRV